MSKDYYTYMPLPWISKSTINAYDFCPYLFKLRYLEGVDTYSDLMQTGLNIHMIYDKFFDDLDYAALKRLPIDYIKPLERTRIYHLILNTLLRRIPLDSREYKPYQILVENFALLETAHWVDLNRKYKEAYSDIMEFFVPKVRERFMRCNQLRIFGSPDRIDSEETKDIRIIYDYKTGHVPIKIVEERDYDPLNPYSWSLQSKRNRELHFYIILDMIDRGYKIDEDIIKYCDLEGGDDIPLKRTYFFDKNNNPVDFRNLYRIGIIYTGREGRPYVPKKKPHLQSMRAVFTGIRKIRKVLANNGPYNKEVNYYRCRNCNESIQDTCLTDVERETIYWQENKNESSELL